MTDDRYCAGASRENPPNLYNMGGLNPQGNTLLQSQWVGIDWLTLNLLVEWGATWKTDRKGAVCLSDKLNDLVNVAQEKGEPVDVPEWGAKVHPGGGKIGGKKYCKFRIERRDAVILIADAPKYSGDWPNVKVEISGERCLVFPGGAEAAYVSAVNWLEELGASIHKESVSRVDLCADFPGMEMSVFHDAYKNDAWACRAKRHHPDISNGVSLYFGSLEVVLRVYDKLSEMQASALRGQPAKYEHMIQKRWGGSEPESATRVEYQLRREWLKSHGISTFDDLTEKTSDVICYLTGASADAKQRWFRFLTAKRDDKHPENNLTLPQWGVVQDAFREVFRCPERLIKIDPDRADIETLVKQAKGVMESAMANKGYRLPWKDTAAPIKYGTPTYEKFEKFVCVMMRAAAAQESDRWKFEEKPEFTELSEAYEHWLSEWEMNNKRKKGNE